MPPTDHRNRRGYLTARALKSGLRDQKAWIDDDGVHHIAEIIWDSTDHEYRVIHHHGEQHATLPFATIDAAREAFVAFMARPSSR